MTPPASSRLTRRTFPGDVVTATAVERAVVGHTGIHDVAVTRDSDGRLQAELRAAGRRLVSPPA